jgi:hypothetical protein
VDRGELPDGGVQLTCAITAQVAWNGGTELPCAASLVTDLYPDGEGHYHIRTIRESREPGNVPIGWARLKSGFHEWPTNFQDPQEVVQAHAAYLQAMDLAGYAALLDPAFEYVVQAADAQDLPWISPDHPWDLAEELGMIGHMMDPAFVSQETGHSVQAMQMNLVATNERAVADDGIEVTAHAVIQVLWAASTGASSDVRFVFTLYPDAYGDYRIRKIQELPLFLRSAGRDAPPVLAVEPGTWGAVKNLYR